MLRSQESVAQKVEFDSNSCCKLKTTKQNSLHRGQGIDTKLCNSYKYFAGLKNVSFTFCMVKLEITQMSFCRGVAHPYQMEYFSAIKKEQTLDACNN